MALQGEDKLAIVGMAFMMIGMVFLWYIFWKSGGAIKAPYEMEPTTINVPSNTRRQRVDTAQRFNDEQRAEAHESTQRDKRVTRDRQASTETNNISPTALRIYKHPEKEILGSNVPLSDRYIDPNAREIFSVASGESLLDGIPEKDRAGYAGNVDLSKEELKATAENFIWVKDGGTGELYLRSRGGLIEIRNITEAMERTMGEGLLNSRRYLLRTEGKPLHSDKFGRRRSLN